MEPEDENDLRDAIRAILKDYGTAEPADIRDELDAEPSRQLVHHHLQILLENNVVEKPHTGVYTLTDEREMPRHSTLDAGDSE